MEWGTWQIWGRLVGDYVKIWQHVIPSEDAVDVFLSVWMLGPLMPSPKHPEPKMTDRPPTLPGWRKLGTCAVEETGWIKAAIAASGADVSGWAHKGLTIEHHIWSSMTFHPLQRLSYIHCELVPQENVNVCQCEMLHALASASVGQAPCKRATLRKWCPSCRDGNGSGCQLQGNGLFLAIICNYYVIIM